MTRGGRALVVLMGLGLAACGGSDSDGAGSDNKGEGAGPDRTTVVLKDIAFKPERLSVKAGEKVTWRFQDKGIPHNVVADDKSFKSEIMDSGLFRHTFEKPGTFGYVCTIHPGMKGTIVVT